MLYLVSVIFAVSVVVFPLSDVIAADTTLDTDADGLSDYDEVGLYYTNPIVADTDGDGYVDGVEIAGGYSPLVANKKLSDVDTDADGLNDALELELRTNLNNPDTDGDGHKDGAEAFSGYNPLKGDNDRSIARHVEVDLTTQRLSYFLGDVKLGSFPVSTGVLRTPTPVGTFAVYKKVPVVHYKGPGYDLPNTKWNLGFKPSYYLHGAYWHNQFGIRPMSHGCVNIAYKDVEKLYAFMDVGDKVVISGKTPKRVQIASVAL
jgi:lipoprotein-anchoring transpeptidase ErfK/SrfK